MNEAIRTFHELKEAGELALNTCLVCEENNYCITTIEEAKKENFEIICV